MIAKSLLANIALVMVAIAEFKKSWNLPFVTKRDSHLQKRVVCAKQEEENGEKGTSMRLISCFISRASVKLRREKRSLTAF
ncbi:hypothetical protein B0H63DRAFT_472294 [Podospora didyma]|uniref:Secreted protein n=1 Tax=Podospora didyma TaxID=330526 RepID=A0AAE0TZD3_9PEZI|nr:hypothetical protein B0H63DRAFT_472294 [Podospora didyma]